MRWRNVGQADHRPTAACETYSTDRGLDSFAIVRTVGIGALALALKKPKENCESIHELALVATSSPKVVAMPTIAGMSTTNRTHSGRDYSPAGATITGIIGAAMPSGCKPFRDAACPTGNRCHQAGVPRRQRPYRDGSVRSHSPTISPIMIVLRLMLARGTVGMIDASATTS